MCLKSFVFSLDALIVLIKDIIISHRYSSVRSKQHVCIYVLNYLSCLAGAVGLTYKKSSQSSSSVHVKEKEEKEGERRVKKEGWRICGYVLALLEKNLGNACENVEKIAEEGVGMGELIVVLDNEELFHSIWLFCCGTCICWSLGETKQLPFISPWATVPGNSSSELRDLVKGWVGGRYRFSGGLSRKWTVTVRYRAVLGEKDKWQGKWQRKEYIWLLGETSVVMKATACNAMATGHHNASVEGKAR